MRIHYIKLKNYRQYLDSEIKFSTDPRKNFTIIQGSNGAGKSNLLNAITWCLYGEERHRDKETEGLPLINEKIFANLGLNESSRIEVEIGLGEENLEYRIRREAMAYRRADGDISVREEKDPVVSFRRRKDWKNSPQPTYTINQLVPEGVSRFFFFDGEALDDFFRDNSSQNVNDGIIRVSQIDLLESAKDHLDKYTTNLRRRANYIDPEIDRLQSELETVEDELEDEITHLKDLEEQREDISENVKAIRSQLRNSDQDEVARLQKERDDLDERVKRQKGLLDEFHGEAAKALLDLAPRVCAKKALQRTHELLNERAERGDLPPKVRQPFFQDLLEEGTCVCGTDLHENPQARQEIEKHVQKRRPENFEGLVEGPL